MLAFLFIVLPSFPVYFNHSGVNLKIPCLYSLVKLTVKFSVTSILLSSLTSNTTLYFSIVNPSASLEFSSGSPNNPSRPPIIAQIIIIAI